jgi:RIO kinase 1
MPRATTTPGACCCATWRTCATSSASSTPALLKTHYGDEIWQLYERGLLRPETELTGTFVRETGPVDLGNVLREVEDARMEEAARLLRMQTPRQ